MPKASLVEVESAETLVARLDPTFLTEPVGFYVGDCIHGSH